MDKNFEVEKETETACDESTDEVIVESGGSDVDSSSPFASPFPHASSPLSSGSFSSPKRRKKRRKNLEDGHVHPLRTVYPLKKRLDLLRTGERGAFEREKTKKSSIAERVLLALYVHEGVPEETCEAFYAEDYHSGGIREVARAKIRHLKKKEMRECAPLIHIYYICPVHTYPLPSTYTANQSHTCVCLNNFSDFFFDFVFSLACVLSCVTPSSLPVNFIFQGMSVFIEQLIV
jgi:hypothetical protein